MKKILLIPIAILIAGCTKPDEEPYGSEYLVLSALLVSDEPIEDIRTFYFDGAGQVSHFELQDLSINHYHLAYENSHYILPDSTANAGSHYTISGKFNGNHVVAMIQMPPPIELMGKLSTDTITIDTDPLSTLQLVFAWTALDTDKYSYVLMLEVLEENPQAIPFQTEPQSSFEQSFSGPQEQAGAVLYETDFRYYGTHRITVFAIEKSLEEVFFFEPSDIRGLLKNGPDNVEGAMGYAAGTSKFSFEIEVE
ncbi:MAG: hypothetical protein ACKVOR_03260 [Flavobacteriales bacterium]